MIDLTGRQKRHLRALGHHLDQALMIGAKGISEGVVRELAETLEIHELVKVRLGPGCDLERKEAAQSLGEATDSVIVQVLGKTILLYRPGQKRKIQLP